MRTDSSERKLGREMEIYFAQFKFYLVPSRPMRLPPYLGSTLRGGFGNVFKRVVCFSRERVCKSCILRAKCPYSYIFETPRLKELRTAYTYSDYPHPYVIEPPLSPQDKYTSEDTISFHLILIGKAVEYLPYFVFVFEELGKVGLGRERGKYKLKMVECMGDKGGESIFSSESKKLLDKIEVHSWADFEKDDKSSRSPTLTLEFLTPTRIMYRNRLCIHLNFEIFLRSLLRRICILSQYHCGGKLEILYDSLLEKAKKVETLDSKLYWRDWERYSSKQNGKMKLGGLVGVITFKGNLGEFLPFIRLGEYIHVGKATSFGLGKYRIVTESGRI